MEKKCDGNESKILFGYFNITMDIMDRDDGSFQRSRIYRMYTDIKIANNTRINHIMVSFTDH